jgi:hypothetical protein
MNRRDLLKLIAASTGMSLIGGGVISAQEPANQTADVSAVFSQADIQKLDEVAETIIPRTDTAGAKDAAVGAFMAVFVADCYTPEQRGLFLSALPDIERRSQEGYKKELLQLTPEERHELVVALDKEARASVKADKPHYFTMIKQLTLMGFFTSKIGATEVLVYDEIPGGFEACVPYVKGKPAWATT